MAKIDPSLVGNPLIFPSAADLESTWSMTNIDSKTREEYEKAFNRVIGA